MFLVVLVAAVLIATALVLTARAIALPRLRASQRVDAINAYGFSAPTSGFISPAGLADAHKDAPLAALAGWFGNVVGPRFGVVRERELRKELLAAGLYRMSPTLFLGYRVIATIGLLAFGWLIGLNFPLVFQVVAVAYCGIMGWVIPMALLHRRASARQAEIDQALPDLIDLLVVTVEAGLGFNASLQVASGRLRGPLAAEVRLALKEQEMGLSTRDALERMLKRSDTPSLRSFVRSIVQGETLGVPIGTIMRNLAAEMRVRRRAAAEEKAQKAPTKMLFPLIFLIMPALMIVLLGPPGVQIMRTLGS